MTLCLSTTSRQLAHWQSRHRQCFLCPFRQETTPWFRHRAHFGVRRSLLQPPFRPDADRTPWFVKDRTVSKDARFWAWPGVEWPSGFASIPNPWPCLDLSWNRSSSESESRPSMSTRSSSLSVSSSISMSLSSPRSQRVIESRCIAMIPSSRRLLSDPIKTDTRHWMYIAIRNIF